MYTNIQKTTSEIWILEQESKRNLTGHNYWEFPPFPQTMKNYSENTLKTTFWVILVLDSDLFFFRKWGTMFKFQINAFT